MTITVAAPRGRLALVSPLRARTGRPWLWWALTRAGCLAVILASAEVGSTSPIFGFAADVNAVYAVAAAHIHAGLLPYRDFAFEYPPGTLPFLLPWPRLDPHLYLFFYAVEMLAVDALILRALRRSQAPWASEAAMLWVFGLALTLGLPLSRNDLPSCLAVVVGLVAYVRRRRVLGSVALALGTVSKIWPATLLALMALVVPRALRATTTAAGALCALTLGPIMLLGAGPGLWRDVVGYHSARGVEVEAAAAVPYLLWGALDGRGQQTTRGHGSTNLVHSGTLASACTVLGVLVVLAVLGLGWRLRSRLGELPAAELTTLACLMVSGSLLAAKVFSAQYAIWLVAVACVARAYGGVDWLESRLVLGSVFATTLVFPFNFFLVGDSGLAGLSPAVVLLARDIALVVLSTRWTKRLLAAAR